MCEVNSNTEDDSNADGKIKIKCYLKFSKAMKELMRMIVLFNDSNGIGFPRRGQNLKDWTSKPKQQQKRHLLINTFQI